MCLVLSSQFALDALHESLGVLKMNDTSDEILELIRQEDDKQTKTFLLILYKMSHALEGNTEGLNRLSRELAGQEKKLTSYVDALEASVNERKGIRKILVPLLGFIQVVLLAFSGFWYGNFKESIQRIEILEKSVVVIQAKDLNFKGK